MIMSLRIECLPARCYRRPPAMRASPALFAVLLLAAPAAAEVHGVPLPRGSHADGDRYTSGLGFRATLDWYGHLWRDRGVLVRTIGPYAARGIDVVRFVRDDRA